MVKSLYDNVIDTIKAEANNNPAPLLGRVKKQYNEDNTHVDVLLNTGGTLQYVPCLLSNKLDAVCLIVFIDGDLESPLAIVDGR